MQEELWLGVGVSGRRCRGEVAIPGSVGGRSCARARGRGYWAMCWPPSARGGARLATLGPGTLRLDSLFFQERATREKPRHAPAQRDKP